MEYPEYTAHNLDESELRSLQLFSRQLQYSAAPKELGRDILDIDMRCFVQERIRELQHAVLGMHTY